MPVLTYSLPAFEPFTKIVSADMNTKLTDIRSRLNWAGGTDATTGLNDANIQSNTASGGGLARATKLALGTADHVLINSGTGAMSSEATLARSRGGLEFAPSLASNAGRALVVNAGETAFELGSPTQSALTQSFAGDISSLTAGEAITIRDAVCLGLAFDSSGNRIYKVFRCDSDLANRRRNFLGVAVAAATVTAHTLTWTNSAALVASNVITWTLNGVAYTQAFSSDNDTTLAAIATQIQAHPDVLTATVVQAGANDRVINITGEGGLQINITGATVTLGASQATVTIATVQAPSGQNVQIRNFGLLSGFSGLTVGALYYLSGTAGGITSTPTDTVPIPIGQALSATQMFITPNSFVYQFESPTIMIRVSGTDTATTYTNAATDVEHFNYTSWATGTATPTARSNGAQGECGYNNNVYFIDGYNTAGGIDPLNNYYNRTAWTVGTTRATDFRNFGIGVLSNTLYTMNGATSTANATGVTNVDSWNGTSWGAAVGTLGTAKAGANAFNQGGFLRCVGGVDSGGSASNTHLTWNAASAGTGTVYPASTCTAYGSTSASSTGIAGGRGAATYQWSGSAWSASISSTHNFEAAAAADAQPTGAMGGFNLTSSLNYAAGGIGATTAATTAVDQFNGTAWSASTAMSNARAGGTGGVI